MIRRPLPTFSRYMLKEEPPADLYKQLIKTYKAGGLKEFEDTLKEKMADVGINQASTHHPETKELLKWVYVGRRWWCRKRKKNKFEFGRMYAVDNTNDRYDPIELWDAVKFKFVPPPVVVYRNGERGVLLGYNGYELRVDWERNGAKVRELIKDCSGITFEYIEDDAQYRATFEKMMKRCLDG